jgi:hypothetical protein
MRPFKKCLDCSVDSTSEAENCVIEGCPFYPYRYGNNPAWKEVGPSKKNRLKGGTGEDDPRQLSFDFYHAKTD